ncbi:MAG TPA: pyridoxal-phosphate dependent enzyme [Bryobacteraceae bacterium]|jgi:cysteine synthase A|nr:pyridoxal-phosphate dependent enzyme [Bryobacteraceae bacterium]
MESSTLERCAAPLLNRYPADMPATPLVPIRLSAEAPLIWCKLEFLNPSGSTKDRIARHILGNAFDRGQVKPGGTVIEASSGSTSISMSLVCAQLGLQFIAVLPEGVSNERVLMIQAYGGTVHFAAKNAGMAGCIRESERLAAELGGFLPRQFANPENADAHQFGTAREILEQIPGGRVDAVVSGVGTGGTLVGLMRGCSSRHAFLARPVDLSKTRETECCSFSCRIPGVMECASHLFRESDYLNLSTIEVFDEEAIQTTRQLIRLGFPVGPSSGLNYRAAMLAAEQLGPAKIVTVLPDRMERYFSTYLFQAQ